MTILKREDCMKTQVSVAVGLTEVKACLENQGTVKGSPLGPSEVGRDKPTPSSKTSVLRKCED